MVQLVALVPVIDGTPQLPIFTGTEEEAELYWEDNPLQFLNRRVDVYPMCPVCNTHKPELPEILFGQAVCQECSDMIAADMAQLRREAEAEAEALLNENLHDCDRCELTNGICEGCLRNIGDSDTDVDDLPF